MRQLLDQIEMLRSGTARLAEIQRESPQRLSRGGKNRRRPARPKSVRQRVGTPLIEAQPSLIRTERGAGYVFTAPVETVR
jgi:hypothetical protein